MSFQTPPPPGSYPSAPQPGGYPSAPQPGGFPSAPQPGGFPSAAPAAWDAPAFQGPPPSTVVNAFRLILVQAALGLVNIVVALFTADAIKEQVLKANPSFDQSLVDTTVAVAMGTAVVFGVIGIVVWTLLAFKVRAGKNWARIVTFVFAGLGLLSGLASFVQPASAISHVLALVALAIDIALIVLLTRGPSAEYFRRTV
ncbi:hypothetical protein DDP54_09520 [Cellulomonas sp. WB94]|uniref:hypothetical protein n=1 Tax=Cellulomonas sp. WB94 TaxID=2173174 RepID=UPI000D588719|nr:hypothetical protein [Cellulomonas sp. WB94]PVU83197.1 hypothetical protein DDP54_09520 [Cellulomonas sp. WB94]